MVHKNMVQLDDKRWVNTHVLLCVANVLWTYTTEQGTWLRFEIQYTMKAK